MPRRPGMPGQTPPIVPPSFPPQPDVSIQPWPMPTMGGQRPPRRQPPNPGPGGFGFVPPSYQDMWVGKSQLPQPPMGPTDGSQYQNRPSRPGAGFDFRNPGVLGALTNMIGPMAPNRGPRIPMGLGRPF